jgi:hypothetical protein
MLLLFGRGQQEHFKEGSAVERDRFALSFAGIIQIRYEGYFSPGSVMARFQDP